MSVLYIKYCQYSRKHLAVQECRLIRHPEQGTENIEIPYIIANLPTEKSIILAVLDSPSQYATF